MTEPQLGNTVAPPVITSGERPRHRDSAQVDSERSAVDTEGLHAQLHAVSLRQIDETTGRGLFRRIVLEHSGGIGVGHVQRDENGNWQFRPEGTTGRIPQRQDFVERYAQCCSATIERNSIQIEHFLGLEAIYAPVVIPGSPPEVLMVLAEEKKSSRTLFVLEIATSYLSRWLKETDSENSNWKLKSLAALIDLVTQMEDQESIQGACQVATSELARHLKCDRIAIGFIQNERLNLQSVTGDTEINRQSDVVRTIETALSESLLRDESGVWPPTEEFENHLLLAHQQLATYWQTESVLSCPLKTVDGKQVGAILLSVPLSSTHRGRLERFVRAAAPRISGALQVVSRAEKGRLSRIWGSLKSGAASAKGRIWCFVAAILLAVMLVPVPYRIRCGSVIESTEHRYAVAPFEGLVKRGHVHPGDIVNQGDLLAEMDGKPIQFELAGVVAELNQASRRREIELSGRKVTESLLAELESQKLAAKKSKLEYQRNQIDIRSPIGGVVLSGSLERAEGSSVKTGEVLFEIAPLKSLKVEVAVPAEEVAHINVGDTVRIWVTGLENQSITGKIDRVHPQSELRDGRNIFVAEVIIPNPDARLRPGMKGFARIDCSPRPLFWNLFHKPANYIATRLTWW